MTKALWEILIPTTHHDNPAKPFTTRHHKAWDSLVRQVAGGLTVLKPGKGTWTSPDKKVFAERVIPVRIFCTKNEIGQIAVLSAHHYKQLAILFYRVSEEVCIFHFEHKGPKLSDMKLINIEDGK